ncbi:protein serine/threonine kinase, putative [Entamoeba invadens IP1]|uniref:Protein serine/threonine kinase, putative n=1 Tax=Entamoeba invadens IP1 TaxID=370355 RepID=A0A0A1TW88_ENTIV|nr:protein serine/threonine kinase, putative [Entamoeba invadens IP1]ELP84793.1 protein serine/threonine kinase, putative [Entamoeba invadens IP1]|eukprot:XP_004184139.1 protein serine/threonine kinase, putative [Entamoeba invadens IP1]
MTHNYRVSFIFFVFFNVVFSANMICEVRYYVSDSSCFLCNAGYYCPDGINKYPCQKGYYSNDQAVSCTICPDGKYAPNNSSSSCITCEAGTYSNGDEKEVCTKCSAGTYSYLGSSKCSNCIAGTYSSSGSSICTSCLNGSYSLDGASKCMPCINTTCATCNPTNGKCTLCSVGSGLISDGICKKCEAGYHSAGGAISCTKCGVNQYSFIGSGSCTECNSTCKTCNNTNGNCLKCYTNSYVSNGVCMTCPAGQYFNINKCLDCQDQTYSSANSSTCLNCISCVTCDRTNGHCTLCGKGQFINNTICSNCPSGTNGDGTQCTPCQIGSYSSSSGSDSCTLCSEIYYSDIMSSTTCKKCSNYCNLCEIESGLCSSCKSGCVLSENHCYPCKAGTLAIQLTNKCNVCPAGTYSFMQSTTCSICQTNTYSHGNSSQCLQCSDNCSSCNNTNGNCITCISGFGLDKKFNCNICPTGTYANSTNNKCQQCDINTYQSKQGQTFCNTCDINCETCDNISGKCLMCYAGYGLGHNGNCEICVDGYYSLGGTLSCLACPSECTNCCRESGECTSCQSGFKQIINQTTGNEECVSCSLNNNCSSCDLNVNETERNCIECVSGYYLEDNKCKECSQITNCVQCSFKNKDCLACSNDLVTTGDGCISCEEGKVKVTSNVCVSCFDLIQNCQLCKYNNGIQTCLKCFAPYVINDMTSECVFAYSNTTHYNYEESKEDVNDVGCLHQVNSSCFMCDEDHILVNKECIEKQNEICFDYSLKTCDNCTENIITTNGNCSIENTCKYQLSQYNQTNCLIYNNDTQVGIKVDNCKYTQNEFCYMADDGYYTTLKNNGLTANCDNAKICQNVNNNTVDISCKSDFVITSNSFCSQDTNCVNYNGSVCTTCNSKYHIENGGCICIVCENKMTVDSKCISTDIINCKEFVGGVCKQCEDDYYKDMTGCLPIREKYLDCEHVNVVLSSCLECKKSFVLVDNSCVENDINKNTTKTFDFQASSEIANNCVLRSSKGCLRCCDGYYILNSLCVKCEYPCTQCSNLTYCTKCDSYSYTKNGKCIEINELLSTCDVMMSTYEGCVACKDGYMRSSDGKQCVVCDTSCATCSNDGDCVICSDGYYRTPNNNTKLCNTQTDLNNCLNKTTSGCTLCEGGFALKDNLCYKCGKNCTLCDDTYECSECAANNILKDGVCIHFSQIPNCISSQNSLCWKCANGYKLSADKIECFVNTNYGVVIGFPIACVVVFVIVIIAIVTVVLLLVFQKKDNKDAENVCVFNMSRSNIVMTKLDGEILSNKQEISFGGDNDKIHIEYESRELLCVGNSSKGNVKIQITTKDKCDKYTIRTEPQIVTLKKGFACEFEVFLTPLCTMDLSDEIVIISLNLNSGKQQATTIHINGQVENSTHLDSDELKEEKKIGEGSFGIVFKGKYRGNIVAIKKMKIGSGDNSQIDEFKKEVAMLDKFRSDYIVHFYGAVFILNKICMVTEFAPFGSLKDVLKSKRLQEIVMKLRVKYCIDGAKGIFYLHENGILHRDIKPDNYLIFSLDPNEKVNAKLTDFGTSRNINMMMTNMTFTKGIGTPKYMAPEILNKKHYKKPADVYSFAVSMFEIITWNEVFKKEDSRFKYAWDIADFISAGNRLVIPKEVPDEMAKVIKTSWAQEEHNRMKIEEIKELIEQYYTKL